MKKLSFVLFFLSFVFLNAQKQKLSEEAEISVLTIDPGSSLNDAFGHNGFRIKDQTLDIDIVFNYGVYDFNAPNFYLNFVRGKLNYKIGQNYSQDFIGFYISQNRTIKEQVLNLTQIEKQNLFEFLINNYKPENQYYLYDFFYDNCATKIRDVANTSLNNSIIFNETEGFKPKTFRQLIHDHVNRNSWGGFGIDLALGSVIDKKATAEEHMFLPYYIHVFFESATINTSKPLVKQTNVLYESIKKPKSNNFFTSPLFVFGVISLLILLVTFFDYKKNKRSIWLDVTIFAFTGIVGVIVLLLWLATDHSATAQNYNLLWAFALNIFVISQLFKKTVKVWFIKYLKFLIIMLCLLTLHWIIGVEIFAIGLIPILIAFFIRYLYLINYYQKNI
ncbi:MAG: DUF4105 domain-containing protein [Flavobacteriaceae bacterium]|nr:DUF4105 domain-containing protein [Flavobacteriaceae bacterium]